MKFSLCLLTWNELEGCINDVPHLPMYKFDEIFALDNSSTDGTTEYLISKGIKVYQQKRPSYNGAYIDAFEYCSTDALIFYHPKGSVDPLNLLKFHTYFENGYDIVVASRNIRGARNEEDSKIIKPRKWFVTLLALFISVLWKKKGNTVWDILHGLRGMTKSSFLKIEPSPIGVSIDVEMVVKSYKKGLACAEFPVKETSRLSGSTHFPAIKTGLKLLPYLLDEIRDTIKCL